MRKSAIKQILLEQKREIELILGQNLVERSIEPQVRAALDDPLVKVIMGVRRCGKSVLAHKVLQNRPYAYVNFDDERLVGVEAEDLNNFLEALLGIDDQFKFLLLDEVQNVEGWELFVNRLQRQGYNLVITGSNAKLLSRELTTHLTGRHIAFELYPFSFREFLAFQGVSPKEGNFYTTEARARLRSELENYLVSGGFPETYLLSYARRYLRDLFEKIVLRDVVGRHNVRYSEVLKELALYATTNFAGPLSYTKLKNTYEVGSVHTVKNYLNYLEEAYLIFQLQPFSYKLKERQRAKLKKVYSVDTGLVQAVATTDSPNWGRLLENVVFMELLRRGREVYFVDRQGYEVDFLVHDGQQVKQLVQVCWDWSDPKTQKRELRGLEKAANEFNCDNLLVIGMDEEETREFPKGNGQVQILPAWQWLC